jgi:regulator of sigma E protease
MLINVVLFLLVFTVVALAHEVGHLFAAKRAGVRVHEFGVGFGPTLWATTRGETTYSVNLIPILAYVNVAETESEGKDKDTPENEKLYNKPIWDKFLVAFLGPLMNIILAFLVLTLIFAFVGVPKDISNVIEKISPNSQAEKVGLKPGDRILAVNNQPVKSMEKTIDFIHQSSGKLLVLKVERGGRTFLVKATPEYNPRLKIGLIGFAPAPTYTRVNPLVALYYGAQQTLSLIALMGIILWQLVTGAVSVRELAGPVGIAQITGKYAESGLLSFVHFFAFLNVNIGVLNLLPLPALDGGRIIFVLLEWIRGKRLDVKIENRINQWGLIALLALMALVTLNDVLRILQPK